MELDPIAQWLHLVAFHPTVPTTGDNLILPVSLLFFDSKRRLRFRIDSISVQRLLPVVLLFWPAVQRHEHWQLRFSLVVLILSPVALHCGHWWLLLEPESQTPLLGSVPKLRYR